MPLLRNIGILEPRQHGDAQTGTSPIPRDGAGWAVHLAACLTLESHVHMHLVLPHTTDDHHLRSDTMLRSEGESRESGARRAAGLLRALLMAWQYGTAGGEQQHLKPGRTASLAEEDSTKQRVCAVRGKRAAQYTLHTPGVQQALVVRTSSPGAHI